MHKKYAKDGLVAISVSIDSLKPEEDSKETAREVREKTIRKVKKELQTRGVTFQSVILDLSKEKDDQEFLQKKLRFSAPPTMFVFNRQGKWTQFNAEELKRPRTLADMFRDTDKLVEILLKKK
jgi:hypothetical protein